MPDARSWPLEQQQDLRRRHRMWLRLVGHVSYKVQDCYTLPGSQCPHPFTPRRTGIRWSSLSVTVHIFPTIRMASPGWSWRLSWIISSLDCCLWDPLSMFPCSGHLEGILLVVSISRLPLLQDFASVVLSIPPPGNVEPLEDLVQRVELLCSSKCVYLSHLCMYQLWC